MDADTFRRRMADLPEPPAVATPPYWEAWRREIWQRGQYDDPANFMKWPCVYHCMLVDHWPGAIDNEWRMLGDSAEPDRWAQAVFVPGTYYGGTRLSHTKNLIHQAYHLYLWEKTTGQRVSDLDSIVEFGGGYGAMALVAHRLGFMGKYVIYDLPEFSLLQEWFLSQVGIESVEFETDITARRLVPDLLIACYSLSECDLVTCENFLANVRPKSCLFLYSGKWESYDNVTRFQQPAGHLAKLQWRHVEIDWLPDPRNFYSIGW